MKLKRGNYIKGKGNKVKGRGNVVLGNKNGMRGKDNWCFTSNYKTCDNYIDEGVLAIGNYKIELYYAEYILSDPRYAISMINQKQFN